MATLINPINQLLDAEELSCIIRAKADINKRHPDAILLFRVGNFYHIVADHAQKTMRDLKLRPALTDLPDAKGIKLISFPHADLDTYLPKLVRYGYRVAIIENALPQPTTIVKRGSK